MAAPMAMPSRNITSVEWIAPTPISLPATAPAKARIAVMEMSMEPISSTHSMPQHMTMLMEPFFNTFSQLLPR